MTIDLVLCSIPFNSDLTQPYVLALQTLFDTMLVNRLVA